MRIGILTSGGDAPGMNAAIRALAVVGRARGHQMIGVRHGYAGVLASDWGDLEADSIEGITRQGGTILGTNNRGDPFAYYNPDDGVVHDLSGALLARARELRIDLFDVRVEPAPGRKVWEARVSAFAASESTPRLMPGLVEAAFAGFPGDSGTSQRVEVPLPVPGR